ncbi:MAG: hypothetical protein WA421_19290 [Nitrososphaeraceae archaeon]
MSYQILQYSCSECGTIPKKTEGNSCRDRFITNTKEECLKCGSAFLKTAKKEWKKWTQQQQYDKRNIGQSSLSSPSPLRQSLLKFQTAYHNYKQPRFILKELSSERASEP